jgi:1,2-phenylacetyl-CoA epoxidase PaaB subunit
VDCYYSHRDISVFYQRQPRSVWSIRRSRTKAHESEEREHGESVGLYDVYMRCEDGGEGASSKSSHPQILSYPLRLSQFFFIFFSSAV